MWLDKGLDARNTKNMRKPPPFFRCTHFTIVHCLAIALSKNTVPWLTTSFGHHHCTFWSRQPLLISLIMLVLALAQPFQVLYIPSQSPPLYRIKYSLIHSINLLLHPYSFVYSHLPTITDPFSATGYLSPPSLSWSWH
jgi:hypothetical protein